MRTIETSIVINVPVETLFDFMLDADHAPAWRDYLSRMEWLAPLGAGARAKLYFWAEGKERTQEIEMVEYDRPRRYALLNRNEGFRLITANTFEPQGSACRVTFTADVTGDTIWASLLLPVIRRRHRKRFVNTTARLKAAAEEHQHKTIDDTR